MKILLLTPPFNLMEKGYGSKRKLRAGFFPPLALGYLAAPLIKKGHQIKIIDSSPLNYENEDIRREVDEFKPDLIGISAVTASAEETYSLIDFLKGHYDLPIVLGGPHVNCFPDLVFKEAPKLDMIVLGEGERIFEEVVDYYEDNKELPIEVFGTRVRLEDGSIKMNPLAESVANLDEVLPPAHELYDYSLYRPLPLQYKKMPVANILTSRGCPWGRCTFCFEAGRASQKYRRHSPERVIKEIKFLIETQKIKEVAFWDDNFLVNEDWVNKFCDLLDKEGIKIPWSAYARVNTINRSMMERASKSGLWNIFYGIESGNQDLLDRIRKGITLDQIRQAIKWSNQLKIDSRGSIMLALPGETPAKALKTIEFACDVDFTYVQFLPTHPEWGTDLYDDALKSGRIVPMYKGRTTPTYIPDGYKDAEEIKKMLHLAYQKFYFRPKYIWKHFKRLRDLSKLKQYFDAFMYIIGVGF
ncbi:MAG: radical SAM protein [Patescibacteria group bacterium]|nr:B12-binding domain-containing radical SAM protein [Patescibacteria group bacterium]MBU2472879.1 B12-binding domain-containing radical SAM protein [Patescibacteria group bacterium]